MSSIKEGETVANLSKQYESLSTQDELEMKEILPIRADDQKRPLPDKVFDEISSLLHQANRKEWSSRPRTYAVLRMINALDLMDDFVQSDCLDIALPYSKENLPKSLLVKQRKQQRDQFLKTQRLVLTQVARIEEGTRRHEYFAENADQHFESLNELGKGGFGSVDRIKSKRSGKIYVRKRLDRQETFEQSSEAFKQFRREVDAMKRLRFHHLVRYVASYTDPQFAAIIMLPVADSDLEVFLNKNSFNGEDYDDIRKAFGCLCKAIMYLQEKRIRHKDIKPKNILVKRGKVYITDFGICRDWLAETRSTTKGPVGPFSMAYAAPEVVNSEDRSTSADTWSLGCVYLDMITVLKGETLKSKLDYFNREGSLGDWPRNNMEAFKGWVKKLESVKDNTPLEWIGNMVREKRTSRFDAKTLMSRIYECDEERDFYGQCCREDGEDRLPGEQNETESEDITSSEELSGDEVSKKKAPDPATVEKRLCSAARAQDLKFLKKWLRRATRLQQQRLDTRAIHLAASSGNVEILHALISFGCNLERKSDNRTPLYKAVQHSREEATQLLVETKTALNTKNSSRLHTALHCAVREGFHSCVDILLKAGVSANICDKTQRTPLISAASLGCLSCVKKLLKNRAKVSLKDEKQRTALHEAAMTGETVIAQTLLKSGATVSLKDNYGRSPLHAAAQFGHNGVILELLTKRADINAYYDDLEWGRTSLLWAVTCKRPNTVQLLLDQRADVNLPAKGSHNQQGTPLHYAIVKDHQAIFESLMSFKPDLERRDRDDRTPLMLAVGNQKIEYIQRLLAAGADVEAKVDVITPLTRSILNLRDFQMAQILIDNKANLDSPDKDNRTMLHWAVYWDRLETIDFLLMNGVDINKKNMAGCTALMLSAMYGSITGMRKLVEHGISIDLQDNNGNTALHYAANVGSKEKTSILLGAGAEPLIPNKVNPVCIPMGLARRLGHSAIEDLNFRALEDAGRVIEDDRWPLMQIFLPCGWMEKDCQVTSRDDQPFIYSLSEGRLTETQGIRPFWRVPHSKLPPAELGTDSALSSRV